MAKKQFLIFVLIQLVGITILAAQPTTDELMQINKDRISLNSSGMIVLGGWAVANIAFGSVAMTQTSGKIKYFNQMNAAWNTVNLAIAGFGYYGLQSQTLGLGLGETISEFQSFENILLFNAGLDVGYMAIGAYLWERGLRKGSDRFVGYGQSMILQGGFLFTFDLILYFMSSSMSSDLINSLQHIELSGSTATIKFPF